MQKKKKDEKRGSIAEKGGGHLIPWPSPLFVKIPLLIAEYFIKCKVFLSFFCALFLKKKGRERLYGREARRGRPLAFFAY